MNIPYFDAHCDTITAWDSIEKNAGQLDAERLNAFAPAGQIFAICYTRDMPGGYKKYLPELLKQIDSSERLMLCRSAEDISSAAAAGRAAALISIEGAEHFGCTTEGLKAAYDLGVRAVNLTWNFDNALSGAAMASGRGLTEEGRRFVAAAQSLGVILDMSHISEKAFWDVLEIARKPVYASHSDSKALCDVPRNLTNDQFVALVEHGGGAGINMCADFIGLTMDIDAVVAHIEHYLAMDGEKAVFLGTDFDGIDEWPRGLSSVQDMPKLYEALLKRNYPESLVRDIFYNNLVDILGRAL